MLTIIATKEGSKMARESNPLYGKIFIEGIVECQSGLHIGAGKEKLEIGGVDAPVIRDPLTQAPYIPGSSLKGKLRSLFERKIEGEKRKEAYQKSDETKRKEELRQIEESFYAVVATPGGKKVRIHICGDDETCPICRLFGSTVKDGPNIPSPLLVRDLPLLNLKELQDKTESEKHYTELKMENVLDRITAHSHPREIERVPRGAKFALKIVYDITRENRNQIKEDVKTVLETLKMIQDGGLGENSTRGSGEVEIDLSGLGCRSVGYYQHYKDQRERENFEKLLPINNVVDGTRLEVIKREVENEGKKEIEREERKVANITELKITALDEWLDEALEMCKLPAPKEAEKE